MSITTMTIGDLCISPHNSRTNRRDIEAIAGMARSLAARGQIYPLVVHPMPTTQGKRRQWGILAGQRRFLAYRMLIDEGVLPPGHPIEVIVRDIQDEGEMIELSLEENLVRVDLRRYEIYSAVARAHAAGRSINEIAEANGQTPETVRQWIRLGNLEAKVFQALADGTIGDAQARAFAATEDKELQRAIFDQVMRWPAAERDPASIRKLLKVGDSDLTRMLNFVGEKAFKEANGQYELDMFADDAEQRGRVVDEGLLLQLVEAKLDRVRDLLRRQCGRDIRFEANYPRDSEYGGIARDLEISIEPQPSSDEDSTRLAALKEEMAELVARAESIVDDDALDDATRARLIAEIDQRYEPMEAEVAAIGDRMTIALPEGNIFATLVIEQHGELEVRFWWANRKEKRRAEKAAQARTADPDRPEPAPISAGIIPPPAAPAIDDVRAPAVTGSAAIDTSYGHLVRQQADAAIRAEHGLTSDGIMALRGIRREVLRAGLVTEAEEYGGSHGLAFVVWSLARLELAGGHPHEFGARRLGQGFRDGSIEADSHVARTEAHRRWKDAVADLRAHSSMQLQDLAAAFLSFCNEPPAFRRKAGAIVAGLMLERSLNAGGYEVPVHNALAMWCALDDPAVFRELAQPTEELVDLFPRAQRIAMARPLASSFASANWDKLKAADLSAPVTRVLKEAKDWVHPLLRFGLAPIHIAPTGTRQ